MAKSQLPQHRGSVMVPLRLLGKFFNNSWEESAKQSLNNFRSKETLPLPSAPATGLLHPQHFLFPSWGRSPSPAQPSPALLHNTSTSPPTLSPRCLPWKLEDWRTTTGRWRQDLLCFVFFPPSYLHNLMFQRKPQTANSAASCLPNLYERE